MNALKEKEQVLGIYYGMKNSCVAVSNADGLYQVGSSLTPSIITFMEEEFLIGSSAKRYKTLPTHLDNTVYDIHTLIGLKFNDSIVQKSINRLSYEIVAGENNRPNIGVNYFGTKQYFCPEQISAFFLSKLKENTEHILEKKISKVVITVPAFFTNSQQDAMKDIAKDVGFDILNILYEPEAAVIAYSLHKDVKETRNIWVFDIGSDVCEISIVTLTEHYITLKCSVRDTHSNDTDSSINTILGLMDSTLNQSEIYDIDDVVITGNSEKINDFQTTLQEIIGKSFMDWIQPNEIIAFGAAINAKEIFNRNQFIEVPHFKNNIENINYGGKTVRFDNNKNNKENLNINVVEETDEDEDDSGNINRIDNNKNDKEILNNNVVDSSTDEDEDDDSSTEINNEIEAYHKNEDDHKKLLKIENPNHLIEVPKFIFNAILDILFKMYNALKNLNNTVFTPNHLHLNVQNCSNVSLSNINNTTTNVRKSQNSNKKSNANKSNYSNTTSEIKKSHYKNTKSDAKTSSFNNTTSDVNKSNYKNSKSDAKTSNYNKTNTDNSKSDSTNFRSEFRNSDSSQRSTNNAQTHNNQKSHCDNVKTDVDVNLKLPGFFK